MPVIIARSNRGNGFDVTVKENGVRRWRFHGLRLTAVQLLLNHYYGEGTERHCGEHPDCPLCESMRTDDQKQARRSKAQEFADFLDDLLHS